MNCKENVTLKLIRKAIKENLFCWLVELGASTRGLVRVGYLVLTRLVSFEPVVLSGLNRVVEHMYFYTGGYQLWYFDLCRVKLFVFLQIILVDHLHQYERAKFYKLLRWGFCINYILHCAIFLSFYDMGVWENSLQKEIFLHIFFHSLDILIKV